MAYLDPNQSLDLMSTSLRGLEVMAVTDNILCSSLKTLASRFTAIPFPYKLIEPSVTFKMERWVSI